VNTLNIYRCRALGILNYVSDFKNINNLIVMTLRLSNDVIIIPVLPKKFPREKL